jgi:hypothetical protein
MKSIIYLFAIIVLLGLGCKNTKNTNVSTTQNTDVADVIYRFNVTFFLTYSI